MRAVLINTPWAEKKLTNLAEWWNLRFIFDDVEHVSLPFIPMQPHPTAQHLAVLDMNLVNQFKKGFTLFVAPYQIPAVDINRNILQSRASVNGIYLPPALSFQRKEWWASRLFWDMPAILVFANENDEVWVGGVSQGNSFDVWSRHEFSHWLYRVIGHLDNTHEHFYLGEPEKAREEILSVLK